MIPSELMFRWLGVGGFEWQVGEFTVLLDPFLTRPGVWHLLARRLKPKTALIDRHLPQADVILVSHAHYDHLMDVPYLARRTGAAVYGSPNSIALARLHDVPDKQLCEVGSPGSFQAGPVRVTLFPGKHVPLPGISSGPLPPDLRLPLRAIDYRMDRCDSMLLEIGGHSWLIWHSIDTHDAPPADFLVVGPEGEDEYFRQLIERVKPQLLIPMHWDNFFRPLSKPPKPLPIRRFLTRTFKLGQGGLEMWEYRPDQGLPVFSPQWLTSYSLEAIERQAEAFRGHRLQRDQ